LSHDALQNLVDDRRKNSLVEISSESTIDLRESFDSRSRQYTTGDVYHLEIFGASKGGDIPGLRANVVNNGGFKPRHSEMSPFGVIQFVYARLRMAMQSPSL
jgi:hypothetical protein